MVFYPDSNPEVDSVDGSVSHSNAGGLAWLNFVQGAGTGSDDLVSEAAVAWGRVAVGFNFTQLTRGVEIFNLFALPFATTHILGAVLSLQNCNAPGSDPQGVNSDINVYETFPASDVALVPGDFPLFGAIPWCDTPVRWNVWNAAVWVDFILNDTAIKELNNTRMARLGLRNAEFDVAQQLDPAGAHVPPLNDPFANRWFIFRWWTAEILDTRRPYLTVTYAIPPTVSTVPATEIT